MYAIYDPVRNRMITFGGSTSDEYFGVNNNTWELRLDGTPTWNQLAPTGTLPSARRSGTAIYDPLRDRMVLFGGYAPGTSGNPRPFGMPPYSLTLSDEEIAEILIYVRSSWGNHARPIRGEEVAANRGNPLW